MKKMISMMVSAMMFSNPILFYLTAEFQGSLHFIGIFNLFSLLGCHSFGFNLAPSQSPLLALLVSSTL